MKKYEITVDAYGPRISKCFHKVIEADNQWVADNTADIWCDSLIQETGGEFDEWAVISVDEYTDTDHEVGDCWESQLPNRLHPLTGTDKPLTLGRGN